jgi:hypothetical protein
MPKVKIPAGTVVLIDKPEEATDKPIAISQSQAMKVLPKKPITDKQKANLEKLIAKNKARWERNRNEVLDALPEAVPEQEEVMDLKPARRNKRIEALKEVPTEIPHNKVLAVVKPPRKYVKKVKMQQTEQEPELIFEAPSTEVSDSGSSEEESEEEEEVRVKPKSILKKPSLPKKYYYASDTSATSNNSDSSEDDDYKTSKYSMKAQKRLASVEQINSRINALRLHREQQTRSSHSVF